MREGRSVSLSTIRRVVDSGTQHSAHIHFTFSLPPSLPQERWVVHARRGHSALRGYGGSDDTGSPLPCHHVRREAPPEGGLAGEEGAMEGGVALGSRSSSSSLSSSLSFCPCLMRGL